MRQHRLELPKRDHRRTLENDAEDDADRGLHRTAGRAIKPGEARLDHNGAVFEFAGESVPVGL